MTKKLVWPATLLASFALAAACGGGTTDDGMGGQGGQDGSTGGNPSDGSGGNATAGQGGLGGGGSNVIQPETCNDDLQNEVETDVDCGGPDCDPCDDDASCEVGADCASGLCPDGTCIAAACGDGVVNGDEECDPGRETASCNVDCTFVECGDGYLNSQAEVCEPNPDLDIWQRCGPTCIHGADLDGTWRDGELPNTDSAWESLTVSSTSFSGTYGYYTYPDPLVALPSFHYIGTASIYDFYISKRYDIADNQWVDLTETTPFGPAYGSGAVDSESIWIPRADSLGAGSMWRFDLASETWTNVPTVGLPNGGTLLSAAVYDGDGFIWYAGGADDLVKYDPTDSTFEDISYAPDYGGFVGSDARLAYDPVSNKILVGGFTNTSFLIYDLASETFSQSSDSPYGTIRDNSCQDRAGGVYVGSGNNPLYMYRYDIATNVFTELPPLPVSHDNGSGCLVSEVGYLYYGTSQNPGAFARLRLNHH